MLRTLVVLSKRSRGAVTRSQRRRAAGPEASGCVMAVFGTNDLRLHDQYQLALAVRRARELRLPLACAFCFDTRTFAQPSIVGGFFRQSPLRAQFLLDTVAAVDASLRREGGQLLLRVGFPENELPALAQRLGARHCFVMTQHAPHEARVQGKLRAALARQGCVLDSAWGLTTVHIDDLQRPFADVPEGLRFFFDEFLLAPIRATEPFDCDDGRLRAVQHITSESHGDGGAAGGGDDAMSAPLPTLEQLGYGSREALLVADAGNYGFVAGEAEAARGVRRWLDGGGMSGYVYPGYDARVKRQDALGRRAARVSPHIAVGALSPRRFHSMVRTYAHERSLQGHVGVQYQEALLRLARRDFWLMMGLRYGRSMFFPYGPTPEVTDDVADFKFDEAVVRKWCGGLTGLPFCDAAMRELVSTGFTSAQGRQALIWLLTCGFGQDWRVGAEWMERCSLDFDPFVCYGEAARCARLVKDDFGETVRSAPFLAHRHDQTGSFVRSWLPQLTSVPTVYIHRPHVLTARMQAMHGVRIGAGGNYPLPLKLWDGAQRTLGPSQLPTYFATPAQRRSRAVSLGEAAVHGTLRLPDEEHPFALQHRYGTDGLRTDPCGTLLPNQRPPPISAERPLLTSSAVNPTASTA